jgi:surface protein
MFSECSSLRELNISNFDVTKVTSMQNMFNNCILLKKLDLSNFSTLSLEKIDKMFYNCSSLEFLDISNFDTTKITSMDNLFYNCTNLNSLYLSSFNNLKVTSMENMFYNCTSLSSLNLGNFNTFQISNLNNIFYNCTSLNYINFYLYDESESLELNENILYNIPENIVICVNRDNSIRKLISIINNKICPTIYCGDDWKEHQKIIFENKTCSEEKSNENTYETDSKSTYLYNEVSTNIKNSEYQDIVDTNIKNSEYQDIADTNIKNSEYQDIVETTYIKETETMDITYNQNENIKNTINVENSGEISDVDLNSEIFDDSNYTSEEINYRIYQEITNDLLKEFTGLRGNEIKKEGKDNYTYLLTSLDNIAPETNNSNGFSKIDLGQCEDTLRKENNLDNETSLLILLVEKQTNESSERNTQFEIYESGTKKKLNLSACDDTPIDIYVPLVLSEEIQNLYEELKDLGYNLLDINDKFYQDICTPYKSPNNTDVLLSDRINYYYNNEETQCQPGCKASDYSLETQYLKCECSASNTEIDILFF